MSTQYVIVVEVDNKRAFAAYQKGLADLALIWGQLIEYAEGVDKERKAEQERQRAKAKKEREESEAARRKYDADMEAWRQKSAMFRGPAPQFPWGSVYVGYDSYCYPTPYLRESYESMKAELQRMADLAGAALTPYRMTEHQVRRMVEWEDGSAVERLKAGIEK